MRLPAVAILAIVLILFFADFSIAKDGDNFPEEHFPALMFLRIEPTENSSAIVAPLHQYQFRFKYYNGGFFQRNLYALYVEFWVDVEGDDWEAFVYPADGYFYPSEKKYGYVSVEAGSRPSNFAYIHLHGRFRDIYGFWHSGNYTFQVRTTQYHSFDVRIEKPFIKARQDEVYGVPIKIRNYGNYEDRFILTPDYLPPGWKITFSDSLLIIPPGGEATTYIYFATVHESIYLQHSTYLIRVRVAVAQDSSVKPVSMIVAVEGVDLTPGEAVALMTGLPPIIILSLIGIIYLHQKNPCNFIPKPWKEEEGKDKKIKKMMKEEWLSGYNYCMDEYNRERKIKKLKMAIKRKQERIEKKAKRIWQKEWDKTYKEREEGNKRIREKYEEMKSNLRKKWKNANKVALAHGKKIEEPTIPELKLLAMPKKIPMVDVPKYKLDERTARIIEPDELLMKQFMMTMKNNQIIMRGERIKMKEMEKEIINRMEREFETIERRMDMEINKIKRKK